MGLCRGYIGVMENKMETTIIGYVVDTRLIHPLPFIGSIVGILI